MKKLIVLALASVFLGAGCVKPAPLSKEPLHFGRVITEEISTDLQPGEWVRFEPTVFAWGMIEKQSGAAYDWSQADVAVKMFDGTQPILGVISAHADWDQKSCHKKGPILKTDSICYVEGYQKWIRALGERYDGDGVDDMPGLKAPINHWEIYLDQEAGMNPIGYLEFFSLAHDEIKAVNPSAQVAFGAVNGAQDRSFNFWFPIYNQERTRGDLLGLQSLTPSNDFFMKEYQAFIDGAKREQTPIWILNAQVKGGEGSDADALARLTFINYVDAFGSGAHTIFTSEIASPEVYDLLVKTIGSFRSVERLGDHTVKFTVNGKEVIALWGGDALPEPVKGMVRTQTYDGVVRRVRAQEVKADKPMFVFVK